MNIPFQSQIDTKRSLAKGNIASGHPGDRCCIGARSTHSQRTHSSVMAKLAVSLLSWVMDGTMTDTDGAYALFPLFYFYKKRFARTTGWQRTQVYAFFFIYFRNTKQPCSMPCFADLFAFLKNKIAHPTSSIQSCTFSALCACLRSASMPCSAKTRSKWLPLPFSTFCA